MQDVDAEATAQVRPLDGASAAKPSGAYVPAAAAAAAVTTADAVAAAEVVSTAVIIAKEIDLGSVCNTTQTA